MNDDNNFSPPNQNQLKHWAGWFVAVVIIISLGLWLKSYLTTGRLVVDAGSTDNSVSLSWLTNSNPKTSGKLIHQANAALSIRLHTGKYVVSVKSNSASAMQIVSISPHHTSKYSIEPKVATGVEPVLDKPVSSVSADSSQLTYLDPQSQSLYRIDDQNNISNIDPGEHFISVKWASSSYGVAMGAAGSLLIVDNGAIKPLSIKPLAAATKLASYDISSDKRIYLSDGKAVYEGAETGGFKKISDDWTLGSSLVAGLNETAVVNSADTDDTKQKESTPTVSVIDFQGHQTTKKLGTFISAWSKGGKYFAVSSADGGEILNSSLKHVAFLPQPNLNNPIWLNDNTLFYSFNDQVWSYDLAHQRSDLIANMPLAGSIAELAISSEGSYVYALAQASNISSELVLKRVGLAGQAVSPVVYQLQSILPQDQPGYSLSLVNFSKPVVYVSSRGDSPPNIFLSQAQALLQQDGFNLSQVQVKLAP